MTPPPEIAALQTAPMWSAGLQILQRITAFRKVTEALYPFFFSEIKSIPYCQSDFEEPHLLKIRQIPLFVQ
jgi:hypothetical protein